MELDDGLMKQFAVIDDFPLGVFGEPCTCFPLHMLHCNHLPRLFVAHQPHGSVPPRPQLSDLFATKNS
jgi:hypothetical protein